ncbi:MAG TPA: ABC transporter permease subunit [Acidimicrobiales bacterium]|nr:ABC transporter permease subunit [Acidimicrobiales bacterium]
MSLATQTIGVGRTARGLRRLNQVDLAALAARLGTLGVVAALWQVFAGGPRSVLPADVVGRPSSILASLWHLVVDGQFFSSLGLTALSVCYALVLAVPIGVGLGLLTTIRPIGWLLQPLVNLTYAIPKVGLVTLYVLLLGTHPDTHVALVLSQILFVFYYATRQAILELDPGVVTALRLMGASRLKLVCSLALRAALPHLLAAIRLCVPLAFATEIFAELRAPTSSGLGVLLQNLITAGDGAAAMAIMLCTALIGYLLDLVIGRRLRAYTTSIGVGLPT